MRTLKERIAYGLCRADNPCWSVVHEIMHADTPDAFTGVSPRGHYMQRAEIALREMLELSDALRSAGFFKAAEGCGWAASYRAVIETALEEGKE